MLINVDGLPAPTSLVYLEYKIGTKGTGYLNSPLPVIVLKPGCEWQHEQPLDPDSDTPTQVCQNCFSRTHSLTTSGKCVNCASNLRRGKTLPRVYVKWQVWRSTSS